MGRRTFSNPYGSRSQAAEEPQELGVRDVLGLVVAERERRDRNAQWEQQNSRLQEQLDADILKQEAEAEKEKLLATYDAETRADAANALKKIITIDPASPDFDSDVAEITRLHTHGIQDKQVAAILEKKLAAQNEFRQKFFPDGTGATYDGRAQFVKTDEATGRRFYDTAARDAFRIEANKRRVADAIESQRASKPADMIEEGVTFNAEGMPSLKFVRPSASESNDDKLRSNLTVERENASQALAEAEKPLRAAKLLQQEKLPFQDPDGNYYRWDANSKANVKISESEYKPYADAVALLGPGADTNKIVAELEPRTAELRKVRDTLDQRISALASGVKPATTPPAAPAKQEPPAAPAAPAPSAPASQPAAPAAPPEKPAEQPKQSMTITDIIAAGGKALRNKKTGDTVFVDKDGKIIGTLKQDAANK